MPDLFDRVRAIGLALPGVTEGASYGTPALHVGKKMLTRIREDGHSLVMKVAFEERDMLMETRPEVFSITPHYKDCPLVLVDLRLVEDAVLARMLEATWRAIAPKRRVAEWEGRSG